MWPIIAADGLQVVRSAGAFAREWQPTAEHQSGAEIWYKTVKPLLLPLQCRTLPNFGKGGPRMFYHMKKGCPNLCGKAGFALGKLREVLERRPPPPPSPPPRTRKGGRRAATTRWLTLQSSVGNVDHIT
eukprot:3053028-Amphidinium_carterae.1